MPRAFKICPLFDRSVLFLYNESIYKIFEMRGLRPTHAETQLLPIVKSLKMVCAQYLVSALRPNHPT